MYQWQLQKAKAHLSQVVKNALNQGPQGISLHGEPTVVVISKKEFDKLKKPKPTFLDLMRRSPLVGIKLNLKRSRSLTRDIAL